MMNRGTVVALFKNAGARYYSHDNDTGYFIFPNDEAVIENRDKIPFLTLWQGKFEEGQMLIVYFDKYKDESLNAPAVLTISVDRKNNWYSARVEDMTFNLGECGNDDLATGRIINSEWMNAVFQKYGTVKIVCQFD